jgi:hypothetical protein
LSCIERIPDIILSELQHALLKKINKESDMQLVEERNVAGLSTDNIERINEVVRIRCTGRNEVHIPKAEQTAPRQALLAAVS